jgi:hypothetical protein
LTKKDKIHLIIVSAINLVLILIMLSIAWDGNDKAVILVIFGYPALIIVNGLLWLILRILKRPENKIYKMTTIGLILLFIPTLLISSMY